jgi:hypothetical protein
MKVLWLSETRTRMARLLGWTALIAALVGLLPWVEPLFGVKGIGRSFAIGAWSSLAALVLALVAVGVNSRAARPRSHVPLVALLVSVPLMAWNGYIVVVIASFGNMH